MKLLIASAAVLAAGLALAAPAEARASRKFDKQIVEFSIGAPPRAAMSSAERREAVRRGRDICDRHYVRPMPGWVIDVQLLASGNIRCRFAN